MPGLGAATRARSDWVTTRPSGPTVRTSGRVVSATDSGGGGLRWKPRPTGLLALDCAVPGASADPLCPDSAGIGYLFQS